MKKLQGAPFLCLLMLETQGGDFEFLVTRKEVKVPTLPQKTREEWGTRYIYSNM
jgi:hypothetical protein